MLGLYKFTQSVHPFLSYLNGRCVDVKLLEDGKRLLIELTADGNVGNVWRVVVVQPVDVLHDAGAVGFDGGQDKQILKVSVVSN